MSVTVPVQEGFELHYWRKADLKALGCGDCDNEKAPREPKATEYTLRRRTT